METVKTVKVRGVTVLAKEDEHGLHALTYANRTQARKATERLGAWSDGKAGWAVMSRHPFLVARYNADGTFWTEGVSTSIVVKAAGRVVGEIDTTHCRWCTDDGVCSACSAKADALRKTFAPAPVPSDDGPSFVARIHGVDGRLFGVRVIRTGDRYGLDDCLTVKPDEKPMAEFYDLSQCIRSGQAQDVAKFGPRGQFVSRYYVATLLGLDGYGSGDGGIDLCGHEPVWKIPAYGMNIVRAALREVAP